MSSFPPFIRPPSDKLPVPFAQVEDATQYCVSLNGEWITYVIGAVEALGDYERYEITTQEERDQIYSNVQELMARFAEAKECVPPMELKHEIVVCEHKVAQGVQGGSTVANVWTKIPMTEITWDDTGEAILFNGQLGLPSGKWKVTFSHVIRMSVSGHSRIRDGLSGQSFSENLRHNGDETQRHEFTYVYDSEFGHAFELQYYASSALASSGLGTALNIALTPETYGKIVAERVRLVPVP